MSSNKSELDLMLNGLQFKGLDCKPGTINDWFGAWEDALSVKSFPALLNLIHLGLRLPLHQEKDQNLVAKLFCHYLAVADGHDSPKNFGGKNSYVTRETDFSNMSHGDLMQKLSGKAWTELCNRVFVRCSDGYGSRLKYSWHFNQPSLATAFINFINPERRLKDGSVCYLESSNIDTLEESGYHAVAFAFAREFLKTAWSYRETMEKTYSYIKEPDDGDACDSDTEESVEFLKNCEFFRKLKPLLANLMERYGILDFLYDEKLDHPTRRMLLDLMAQGNHVSDAKVDVATLYGQLHSERGNPVLGRREPARILLLYPYVVKGRKEFVREQVRQRQAAKAAKAEQLRREMAIAAAKLEALK